MQSVNFQRGDLWPGKTRSFKQLQIETFLQHPASSDKGLPPGRINELHRKPIGISNWKSSGYLFWYLWLLHVTVLTGAGLLLRRNAAGASISTPAMAPMAGCNREDLWMSALGLALVDSMEAVQTGKDDASSPFWYLKAVKVMVLHLMEYWKLQVVFFFLLCYEIKVHYIHSSWMKVSHSTSVFTSFTFTHFTPRLGQAVTKTVAWVAATVKEGATRFSIGHQ